MSLIHWWPLNGDTQDKITGQSGSLIGGGNVDGSGKIGKCYSSTNNSSTLASCSDGISVANCNLVDEVGNQYSFACWFLVHGTHGQYQSCIMSSGDWNKQNCWVIGFNKQNTSISCPVNGYNRGLIPIGFTLANNKWYHLATVYNNGTSYAYLDGELIGSITSPGIYQSSSTTACIGRDQAHGGFFPYNGDINDLRIYDHALSQAEVKELSKALVVHYTFDDVCTEPTTNIITGIKSAHGKASLESGRVKINWSPNGDDSYFMFNCSQTIKANCIYTLSFDCEGLKSGEVATFAVSNLSAASYNIALKNGRNSLTFTAGSDLMSDINTHNRLFFDDKTRTNGAVFYLSSFQLEERNHATPYTSTSRESMLYNETGLTQPNYKANLQLAHDAGSGTYSLKCAGSTAINTPVTGDISQGAMVAFWIKTPTYPSGSQIVFADYNSHLAFGFYNSTQAIISCGGQSSAVVSNLKASWPEGVWHHVVITRNGSTFNCYLNGTKLSQSGSNNWSSSAGYSTIGCRYNGSYTNNSNCLISDFRLYYTYPGDDKIAQVVHDLYKTKAYITDKGDIESHQFIEDKAQAQVTSKYSFEADEFYEELYDGYDVLEYIESTGTQYVDTGYVATSTDYTYELDITPTKIGGFYSYMGFMANGNIPRAGIHEYSGTFMLGANTTTQSSTAPVVNERVVLKGHFKSGAQKLYKNGTLIASNATTFNHNANTLSTHIFGRNYSGRNLTSIKLYSAKIYEGSTLVRHYIPVRRQSDNVLGLYDILTNTFCANSGSGTFKNGPARTNKNASIYEDMHVSGRKIIEI